jgi:dienelactone hydrolase
MLKTIMLFIYLLLVPTSVLAGEEIVKIDTRPGVTLNLLIVSPATQTDKALIMFPGGSGYNHFGTSDGLISKGDNFLVRTSPDFAKKGLLVVVVDSPSDRHAQGMDDDFRTSKTHLQDITKVVDYLTAKGYRSIYLVGTSRGTISAAYIGAELKHSNIAGLILTSTMSYSKFLRWIALDKVTCPVLIVHNSEDSCKTCPFREASGMIKVFKNSSRVDFVSVNGGSYPQSGPCEPLSPHGYFGIESEIIGEIVHWILNTS